VLRTNLSTRPFYNERAAHLLIGLAAAVVMALTAWNVLRIVTLSRQNTELSSRISRETVETDNLTSQAAQIRKTINREELASVVAAAQEANSLIDQRTFSWTRFFNRIESTLPPDVMLTSVRPSFNKDGTTVTMIVLGRRSEDIDEFMEKLEATGAFEEALPGQGDHTEQGLIREVIQSKYLDVEDEPAETPAADSKPAPDSAAPAAPDKGAAPQPSTAKVTDTPATSPDPKTPNAPPQRGGRQ
jgi:Tfp pilus assembly protein PilN